MYKYIILAVVSLSILSTVVRSESRCRAGWTGNDCTTCTPDNSCGCDNSTNFKPGKYYSCYTSKKILIPVLNDFEYPGISFVCGSDTCYVNIFESGSEYSYGRQESRIQCKLTGCEYNQLNAQCSDMVCDCRNCGTIVYELVQTMKGKSSISCANNGTCNFNGPTALTSIININPVPLQCIAGSCEKPITQATPSIVDCTQPSGVSSLMPLTSIVIILSIISLLF